LLFSAQFRTNAQVSNKDDENDGLESTTQILYGLWMTDLVCHEDSAPRLPNIGDCAIRRHFIAQPATSYPIAIAIGR